MFSRRSARAYAFGNKPFERERALAGEKEKRRHTYNEDKAGRSGGATGYKFRYIVLVHFIGPDFDTDAHPFRRI